MQPQVIELKPKEVSSRSKLQTGSQVTLKIRLLGEFQVWRNGQFLQRADWRTRKAESLFKIMLTQRGHVVLQDQLIEFLWSRLTPHSALNSLWVCVNYLRHTLEPKLKKSSDSRFILSRTHGYLFDSAGRCSLDTDDFMSRMKAGERFKQRGELKNAIGAYQAADALYRGDYLEEVLYEDWPTATRQELQEAHYRVLKHLGECHQELEQYEDALTCYQKILIKEPCREAAWRHVMLCYWRMGECNQALQVFERCQRVLEQEIRVKPMAETVELYHKIKQGVG